MADQGSALCCTPAPIAVRCSSRNFSTSPPATSSVASSKFLWFHLLVEFDEVKMSYRKWLEGHNRHRRKPQPDPLNLADLFSNHHSNMIISIKGYWLLEQLLYITNAGQGLFNSSKTCFQKLSHKFFISLLNWSTFAECF